MPRSDYCTVVLDGNEKVLVKCAKDAPPPKRAGAPRKNRDGSRKRNKPHSNGRFFACCPNTGRILRVSPLDAPENNKAAIERIKAVVNKHKRISCVVYDRACKIAQTCRKDPSLRRVRHYARDKTHGRRHAASCERNPHYVSHLRKRLEEVNTEIAEQTFARLRG